MWRILYSGRYRLWEEGGGGCFGETHIYISAQRPQTTVYIFNPLDFYKQGPLLWFQLNWRKHNVYIQCEMCISTCYTLCIDTEKYMYHYGNHGLHMNYFLLFPYHTTKPTTLMNLYLKKKKRKMQFSIDLDALSPMQLLFAGEQPAVLNRR